MVEESSCVSVTNNDNIVTAVPSCCSNDSISVAASLSSSSSNNVSAIQSPPTVSNAESMVETMFVKLDPTKKWILSTGKCVDNELYMFRLQCSHDHPSKSLVMDPNDANYTKFNVFAPEELEEIRTHNEKKLPLMSPKLKKHLMAFNKNSSKDVKQVLKANNTFDDSCDPDKDWVNYVTYSILRQYEAGNMTKPHRELWY